MSALVQDEKPTEGSIQEEAQIGTVGGVYIDPVAEKKVSAVCLVAGSYADDDQLIRKLDLMLSPMMVLIFLVAYLDRSNIGMPSPDQLPVYY